MHEIHLAIEGIQKNLNLDQGSFTRDLTSLNRLGAEDPVVQSAMVTLTPFLADLFEKGVPTVTEI